MHFSLGRLYTNALLATLDCSIQDIIIKMTFLLFRLNSRKNLRSILQGTTLKSSARKEETGEPRNESMSMSIPLGNYTVWYDAFNVNMSNLKRREHPRRLMVSSQPKLISQTILTTSETHWRSVTETTTLSLISSSTQVQQELSEHSALFIYGCIMFIYFGWLKKAKGRKFLIKKLILRVDEQIWSIIINDYLLVVNCFKHLQQCLKYWLHLMKWILSTSGWFDGIWVSRQSNIFPHLGILLTSKFMREGSRNRCFSGLVFEWTVLQKTSEVEI